MNYHSDEWVMNQINRHYLFANELYDSNQIVGVFCQGSTNYGLDCENSDIDTKCIVVPSFKATKSLLIIVSSSISIFTSSILAFFTSQV